MTTASVNRITNANVYLGRASQLGKAGEIKLDDLQAKMEEVAALGLVGTLELISGLDKINGTIKWNSFYPENASQLSNPFTPVTMQVRSSLETHSSLGVKRKPMVTLLTVRFTKSPLGQWQQHKNSDFDSAFSVLSVKQMVDGNVLLEFDVLNNIFIVDGVDLLAEYRSNIGG